MTRILWGQTGERVFETGVDRGVLYIPTNGSYDKGYAWNGLTAVTEKPSGAEPTALYADNIKYLNLMSAEEFGCTVEAFTYPDEFMQCDGSAALEDGVFVGQQPRKTFGMSYRTKRGDDVDAEAGHKLHLVYGCLAAPSERNYNTVNESPEAINFSWDVSTTPVEVPGNFKPTALITIDSTKVDSAALAVLEDFLYGTVGTDPSLPLPAALKAIFAGTMTVATPTKPSATGNDITIPTVTGVVYKINGVVRTGTVTITENVLVTAHPAVGYKFPAVIDTDWLFVYAP